MNIRRYTSSDWPQLKQLSVFPAQERYVGTIQDLFVNIPAHYHYYVIEKETQLIGFFNIDLNYPQQYDFAHPNELGFRAFFIDQSQQGKGYCTAIIQQLRPYLQAHYPHHSAIVLTVNCKNPAAYRCYQKGGFHDTQKKYLGGSAGPQYIMRMPLKSA